MTLKSRLKNTFQRVVLKPQLGRLDAWEQSVIDRPGSLRGDLVPVYSFNGDGLWKARSRGRGQRVGGPRGIRLWRNLTARMERERSPGSSAPDSRPVTP